MDRFGIGANLKHSPRLDPEFTPLGRFDRVGQPAAAASLPEVRSAQK